MKKIIPFLFVYFLPFLLVHISCLLTGYILKPSIAFVSSPFWVISVLWWTIGTIGACAYVAEYYND